MTNKALRLNRLIELNLIMCNMHTVQCTLYSALICTFHHAVSEIEGNDRTSGHTPKGPIALFLFFVFCLALAVHNKYNQLIIS